MRPGTWATADASANPPVLVDVPPDSFLVPGAMLRATIQRWSDSDSLVAAITACQAALGIKP